MIAGQRLHRIAGHICSALDLEQIVEPALADFQHEYALAKSGWSRRLVVLRGYVALLRVIAYCALVGNTNDDERRVISRSLVWTAGTIAATTCLLLIPPVAMAAASGPLPAGRIFLLMVVPQALPLAIPIGVIFGVAMGVAGHAVTLQVKRAIVGVSVLGAIVSFSNMAWLMPAANQAFRQTVFAERGGQGTVVKGAAEMSLSELRRAGGHHRGGDRMSWRARLNWMYHLRFSLAFAGPLLAMLAFALIERRAARWLMISTCLVYYGLLVTGEAIVYGGATPWLGAWLANGVIAGTTLVLRYAPTETNP